jgi:hypothetical protein
VAVLRQEEASDYQSSGLWERERIQGGWAGQEGPAILRRIQIVALAGREESLLVVDDPLGPPSPEGMVLVQVQVQVLVQVRAQALQVRVVRVGPSGIRPKEF